MSPDFLQWWSDTYGSKDLYLNDVARGSAWAAWQHQGEQVVQFQERAMVAEREVERLICCECSGK